MAKFNLTINIDNTLLDNANLSVIDIINNIGELINGYCAEKNLFTQINAEIIEENNSIDQDNSNDDNNIGWIEGYRVSKIPS